MRIPTENINVEDLTLICRIADRAADDLKILRSRVITDLHLCHTQIYPLRLANLLASSDDDFEFDITGITSKIDHEAQKLRAYFVPRHAILTSVMGMRNARQALRN